MALPDTAQAPTTTSTAGTGRMTAWSARACRECRLFPGIRVRREPRLARGTVLSCAKGTAFATVSL